MEKVEIKSIKIKIGKVEANITIEEAKKLKGLLEDIFGKEKEVVTIPSYPIYIDRCRPYWYCDGVTYCSNAGQLDMQGNTLTCSIN